MVNDPECGRVTVARRRVVGGDAAGFGQFPWQALVHVGRDRCGGALVNRRHVVTAGHCLFSRSRGAAADPWTVRVRLGEYAVGRQSEPLPAAEFAVEKVMLHPYYQWKRQVRMNLGGDVIMQRGIVIFPPNQYCYHYRCHTNGYATSGNY